MEGASMLVKSPEKPKSMTWTQVKKHIQDFSQASLLDLIHQMYNASDINKAFLTACFQPEATLGSKELTDMKKRIHRLMCPNLNSYNADPQIREARKIITEYKKTKDTLGTLDLMLAYVEAGNEFTCTYGDIDSPFYDSLCSMLDAFAKLFQQSPDEYRPYFQDRLQALARSASNIGWGYGDYVSDVAKELGVC
jgi:hypothetical protein